MTRAREGREAQTGKFTLREDPQHDTRAGGRGRKLESLRYGRTLSMTRARGRARAQTGKFTLREDPQHDTCAGEGAGANWNVCATGVWRPALTECHPRSDRGKRGGRGGDR